MDKKVMVGTIILALAFWAGIGLLETLRTWKIWAG